MDFEKTVELPRGASFEEIKKFGEQLPNGEVTGKVSPWFQGLTSLAYCQWAIGILQVLLFASLSTTNCLLRIMSSRQKGAGQVIPE